MSSLIRLDTSGGHHWSMLPYKAQKGGRRAESSSGMRVMTLPTLDQSLISAMLTSPIHFPDP